MMKTGERMMFNLVFRIILDTFIILLAVSLIVSWRAVMPGRLPISLRPEDLGLSAENVKLVNKEGIVLSGWFIPAVRPQAVIICLHGYPANKSDILPSVVFLQQYFSLLLFDFRGQGESGGRLIYFGLKETYDVKAALDFLQENPGTKDLPVGIWGYSLGAAVAILTAAMDKRIKAVVSDSAFASFPEMVSYYYRGSGFLRYLLAPLSRLMGKIFLRADFTRNSPECLVSRVECPLLIIHSLQDEYVPPDHARRLFEKAKAPKELFWKSGSHSGSTSDRDLYEEKVLSFFRKALSDKEKKTGGG